MNIRAATLLLWLAGASGAACADSNALWHLIDTLCVPHAAAAEPPPPCARTVLQPDREHGWMVLKDRNGRLQYLAMPTAPIAGIESPLLTRADTTNYFARAWASRDLLDKRNGAPLPRQAVSLTVNSRPRRSQNQLHIHISCVQPELRARLLAAQSEIGRQWSELRGGWVGHRWWIRRIDVGPDDTLDGVDPFRDVRAGVPDAASDMGLETIGVVALRFADGRDGFVLMASRFDAEDGSSGSAEGDLQDHSCRVLDPTVPASI